MSFYEKIKLKQSNSNQYVLRFVGDNPKIFADFMNKMGQYVAKGMASYNLEYDGWQINSQTLKSFELYQERLSTEKAQRNYLAKKKQEQTMAKKTRAMLKEAQKNIVGWENVGQEMKLQPYDYQKQIIKFCIDTEEALIVAPCGAGKTPCLVGAYLEARKAGKIEGPGMIVVKASLKTQWAAEIKKFSDLTPVIIRTYANITSKESRAVKKIEKELAVSPNDAPLKKKLTAAKKAEKEKFLSQFQDADIYVLNYETLQDAKVRKALREISPQFVAADEVHFIKSASSKRNIFLTEFNKARIKIGATATPVKRNPQDLYGIFKLVKPDLFLNKKSFDTLYIKFDMWGQPIGSQNEADLNRRITPHMIIKTKEEVAKFLPRLVVQQRYCDLEPAQQKMHEKLMEELNELHEEEKQLLAGCSDKARDAIKKSPEFTKIEAGIMARQTFAQELADSELLLQDSESEMSKEYVTKSKKNNKLDLLADLVSEIIDSGEKVCIFSRYKRMQPIITARLQEEPELKGVEFAYVNGSISGEARYEEVYIKFRDNPSCKVLIMSDAGAEGINLSQCQYLIEYEPAESFAIQTQRHGRVERADATHDTAYVYQLIARESYDEIAQKIVSKKERYDSQIIRGESC